MSSRKINNRPVRVVLVIDKSSSMSRISSDMVQAVNSMIQSLKGKAKELAIISFADKVNIIHPLMDMSLIETYTDFHCYGNTALFDATGKAIEILGNDKNYNYLVILFTDGEENCSTIYNKYSIRKLIEEKEKSKIWTVTFQVPKGREQGFHDQFGISLGNITGWENTAEGTKQASHVTTQSISNYFDAVSRGKTQVKNFYHVDVDMHDVTSKDIKNQLIDLKEQYKVISVDKEDNIKSFIERKTKKPYGRGNCYYQLTKPEVVQKTKDILIMEHGKESIFGGNFARNLIGLPGFGAGNSKVTPANLGKYRVFVQSTSVNRKLVRGSKILVKN